MIHDLSIIIPVLNEEKFLPHLLVSLSQQDFQGKWEVIVVDGRSSDKTKKVAELFKEKLPNLTIISSERGVSRQRNAGAKRAKFNYFLFLDADTVVPKSFISKLTRKINPEEKKFIGLPLILPLNGTPVDYAFVYIAYNGSWLMRKHKPVLSGMCFITTKSNHEGIGGFDERKVYAEDMDYGLRSKENGAKYHLYLRSYLFTSMRRGRKMGRRNLSKLWISSYLQLILKGHIENQSMHDYPYGHHDS